MLILNIVVSTFSTCIFVDFSRSNISNGKGETYIPFGRFSVKLDLEFRIMNATYKESSYNQGICGVTLVCYFLFVQYGIPVKLPLPSQCCAFFVYAIFRNEAVAAGTGRT